MTHSGELVALVVSILWTTSAIVSEVVSKRLGVLAANVSRMILALSIVGTILLVGGGMHLIVESDMHAWSWLLASGFVGYTFGDFCLYRGYDIIGSRYTQLLMTLAAPFAAITSWAMLDEQMSAMGILGMLLTLLGIGMTILGKGDNEHKHNIALKLPVRGVVFGVLAALGQGVGLVLSKIGVTYMATDGGAFMSSFAGTFIRGIAGLSGFLVLLFMRKQQGNLRRAFEGTTPSYLIAATLCGPTIGVSLSLLAVQLTNVGIAQTIMSTTPILILLPTYLIYHQPLTTRAVVGTIISVVGVSLFFVH
ncbi:MAG: DMT family transporter [Bacteroidales bacterium]|nr:DMT family transporter [Bacteroidales bacterium]